VLFTITGKHIDITEALRTHAQEKTAKLPRFYDNINQVNVIISGNSHPSGRNNVTVEIIATIEHDKEAVVTESGEDAYICLDIAVHKLERLLTKKKEKQREHKRPGPA